jgi:hypothetical protein
MVLTTSGRIASCKLGQGQGTAPDCEDAENDTIDDDDETTSYDTKEEACDETAPAVTDVEPAATMSRTLRTRGGPCRRRLILERPSW